MRVLAVTSWGGACGIANYAEMLRDHLPKDIDLIPQPEALDPLWLRNQAAIHGLAVDVVWLNHHRGLHSRWTPQAVADLSALYGTKVVITLHDTYGESAPDPLAQQLHDLADAFIVHEPCVGLPKQILIRQGVLGWQAPWVYDEPRPILGTCGFNFPWKGFDRLAEATADTGWAYVVLSNNATDDDERRWQAANPHTTVIRGFQTAPAIVSHLAGCDATAFPYECANSGTSGAIRLGIAARKPVLAFSGCRQFRDLDIPEGRAILWCEDWAGVDLALRHRVCIQRCDPGIVALAERDSWASVGRKYAALYRGLL